MIYYATKIDKENNLTELIAIGLCQKCASESSINFATQVIIKIGWRAYIIFFTLKVLIVVSDSAYM